MDQLALSIFFIGSYNSFCILSSFCVHMNAHLQIVHIKPRTQEILRATSFEVSSTNDSN